MHADLLRNQDSHGRDPRGQLSRGSSPATLATSPGGVEGHLLTPTYLQPGRPQLSHYGFLPSGNATSRGCVPGLMRRGVWLCDHGVTPAPPFPTVLILCSGSGAGSPARSRMRAARVAGRRLPDGPCTEPRCGQARGVKTAFSHLPYRPGLGLTLYKEAETSRARGCVTSETGP